MFWKDVHIENSRLQLKLIISPSHIVIVTYTFSVPDFPFLKITVLTLEG